MSLISTDLDFESVLKESGVLKTSDKSKSKETFDENGAGITEAAKTIAYMMEFADSEVVKLKAAELALKVHGVFDDPEISRAPQVQINIISTDNSKTLVQLLTPQPRLA